MINWKRAAALLSAVILFLASGRVARADQERFGLVNGVNGTGSVNLREYPSLDAERIGRYGRGEWVSILSDDGNGWYYVQGMDHVYGYMSSEFVLTDSDPYGIIGVVVNPEGTKFLNLRATPSYSAKVLGTYYTGVPCILLGVDASGWYHVRVNGTDGYFRSEYVQQTTTYYNEKIATIVTPDRTAMNMRQGPDKSYPIIHQFNAGAYVMVLQQGVKWWRVCCEGYVGYMDSAFLKDGVWSPDGTNSLLSANVGSTPVITTKPVNVIDPVPYQRPIAIVTNPKQNQVLNLRVGPDSSTDIIGQYPNGTQLDVLAQGVEWCKVRSGFGVVGYMMTDFLTLHNLPETPTARVDHPQRSYVYLRSMPSKTNGVVMISVPHGAQVTMMIPGEQWSKVRYNGQTGYMMTDFLAQ